MASLPPSHPDPATINLDRHAKSVIYDANGERAFADLYSSPGRHLLIFNRHFFCGLCEDYTRALAAELPPSSLPADTSVALLSLGDASLIPHYISRTNCPFPVYAERDGKLYTDLGMAKNTKRASTLPKYVTMGLGAHVVDGFKRAFANLSLSRKTGPVLQHGGEILIVTDAQGTSRVEWCHFMQHFTDHTEIDGLKCVLGMDK